MLHEYAGHGGTVVMATHDLDFAAAAGARLMPIADGRMAAPGPGRDRGGCRARADAGGGDQILHPQAPTPILVRLIFHGLRCGAGRDPAVGPARAARSAG
jgi:hypothetical protein